MTSRLQEKYKTEVVGHLMERFNYSNVMEVPKLEKIIINIGLAFRDKGLFWKKFSDFNEDGSVKTDVGILLKVKQISSYGNDSYGGMSGREIYFSSSEGS